MRYYYIAIALPIILLCVAASLFLFIVHGPSGSAAYATVLQTGITYLGPERAGYVFDTAIGYRQDLGVRHDLEHRFAEALYAFYDFGAWPYCNEIFSNRNAGGCEHEVLGRAVADAETVDAAENMLAACHQKHLTGWLMCEHSLGHGLLLSQGYTLENLKQALSKCDDIQPRGCYGGVFMEYLIRGMMGTETQPIVRTEENTYSTCDALDQRYRHSCIFWQAKWWYAEAVGSDLDIEVVKTTRSLCDAFEPRSVEREICMASVGHSVSSVFNGSDNSVEKSYHLCEQLGETVAETQTCAIYAGRRLHRTPYGGRAKEMCTFLEGAGKAQCENSIGADSTLEETVYFDEE